MLRPEPRQFQCVRNSSYNHVLFFFWGWFQRLGQCPSTCLAFTVSDIPWIDSRNHYSPHQRLLSNHISPNISFNGATMSRGETPLNLNNFSRFRECASTLSDRQDLNASGLKRRSFQEAYRWSKRANCSKDLLLAQFEWGHWYALCVVSFCWISQLILILCCLSLSRRLRGRFASVTILFAAGESSSAIWDQLIW